MLESSVILSLRFSISYVAELLLTASASMIYSGEYIGMDARGMYIPFESKPPPFNDRTAP